MKQSKKVSSLTIAVGVEMFYSAINGVKTTTVNLCRHLLALGHKPFIITPTLDRNKTFEVFNGVPVYYIPGSVMRMLCVGPEIYPGLQAISGKSKRMVARIMREQRCDVVHITAPWKTCRSMLTEAKKLGVPTVHTFHTNLCSMNYIKYAVPFAPRKCMRLLQCIAWKLIATYIDLSTVITTPGHSMYQELIAKFPKRCNDIIEMANGIEVQSFMANDDKLLRAISPHAYEHKGRYGIFIGRLGQEKSIDVLLDSVAIVCKRIPDFQLILIGDGPYMKQYVAQADELGLHNNVHFLGKIDHDDIIASGIVKNARFFVSASVTEVQSMTIIEALCSRTPAVLARHGSMTGLAKDAAVYAAPGNIESFADAMCSIITDNALYNKHRLATESQRNRFDGRTVAKNFEALYRRLLTA